MENERETSFQDTLVLGLIYLIFFQDYLGLLLFNIQPSYTVVKCFLGLKDMVFVFLLVGGVMAKRRFPFSPVLLFMALYAVTVLIYFFALPNSSAYDLRSLLFPFYCMFTGYLCNRLNTEKFSRHFKMAAVTSTLIALALYCFGPSLLIRLKLLQYTEQGRGAFGYVTSGLPSGFFSFFGPFDLFRLAGGIMNPIAMAGITIFAFAVLFGEEMSTERKNPMWVYWALITASLLTFSRGPLIGGILGLVLGLIFWRKKISSAVKKRFRGIGILALLLLFFGTAVLRNAILSSINMVDGSSKGHYVALTMTWESISRNWMGMGVGASGQWENNDLGLASENSYGMIVGQVGIVAFFFLVVSYFFMFRNLLKNKNHFLSFGLFLSFVMFLVNGIFSPGLLSVTPLTLFWFLVGYFEATAPFRQEAL
jgi:hypothetical protein